MASRLIFFGNERLATGVQTTAPILQALVGAGYDVAGLVIAQNDAGKSRKDREVEIVGIAEGFGIPVIRPTKLDDEIIEQLKKLDAVAAILVAYGKIVPQSVIDIFPKGIINIHPSLLPAHRGSIPIESVILKGETKTGVSLMQLDAKMDTGPVYAQKTLETKAFETKAELVDRLALLGKDMLLDNLPAILDGSLRPENQDEEQTSYDGRLSKDDSNLDFTKAAAELERQVRAYAGWPRSRANIGTSEVVVTQAHIAEINGVPGTLWINGKQLGLHCSEGVLVIDKLILAGKKEMTAEAFLAGYNPLSN